MILLAEWFHLAAHRLGQCDPVGGTHLIVRFLLLGVGRCGGQARGGRGRGQRCGARQHARVAGSRVFEDPNLVERGAARAVILEHADPQEAGVPLDAELVIASFFRQLELADVVERKQAVARDRHQHLLGPALRRAPLRPQHHAIDLRDLVILEGEHEVLRQVVIGRDPGLGEGVVNQLLDAGRHAVLRRVAGHHAAKARQRQVARPAVERGNACDLEHLHLTQPRGVAAPVRENPQFHKSGRRRGNANELFDRPRHNPRRSGRGEAVGCRGRRNRDLDVPGNQLPFTSGGGVFGRRVNHHCVDGDGLIAAESQHDLIGRLVVAGSPAAVGAPGAADLKRKAVNQV